MRRRGHGCDGGGGGRLVKDGVRGEDRREEEEAVALVRACFYG